MLRLLSKETSNLYVKLINMVLLIKIGKLFLQNVAYRTPLSLHINKIMYSCQKFQRCIN
jgi:hypothetical protein